jgi:hypothetical protein
MHLFAKERDGEFSDLLQLPNWVPSADTFEITAIPKVLSSIDIEDAVVTIDAIGTQTGIAEQIIDQGGHF